jgi:hypothetical protein
MFSARGVALKVTTVSVQLRVFHNSVYISARLKLPGTNYSFFMQIPGQYLKLGHDQFRTHPFEFILL